MRAVEIGELVPYLVELEVEGANTVTECRSPYKAVVFDLFGTLIPSYSVLESDRVIDGMGTILGVPPKGIWCWYRDFWAECATGKFPSVETTIAHICTTLGVEVDPERVMKVVQIRMEFTRRSLVASKDTIELLHQLRSIGYKIGLISDCALETPLVWPSTNLAPLVDAAVFSCMVGLKKPDPRIYHLASQMLELRSTECLYVGDGSSRELSGALAAGMNAVLLRIPLDDAYDVQRTEVDEWMGPSILTVRGIVSLLGCG